MPRIPAPAQPALPRWSTTASSVSLCNSPTSASAPSVLLVAKYEEAAVRKQLKLLGYVPGKQK